MSRISARCVRRLSTRSAWSLSVAALVAAGLWTAPPLHAAQPDNAQPVVGRHGMVASSSPIASQVGVDIMKKGGNAIDAAVAVGFAEAVTHPFAGNLGGGGFMVIHLADGRDTTIDYREVAPGKASRDMYLDANGNPTDQSRVGPLAVGVPGSVAGLAYAERKYGKLKLADVIAPAIALAEHGFVLNEAEAASMARARPLFEKWPATAKIFLKDGQPYQAGDRLVQTDLARTLRLIAAKGPDAFYRGPIADQIAAEMQAHGGLITKADLAAYKPVERKPITGTYRGYRIVSMPPASSGGIAIVELLNILEGLPIAKDGFNTPATIHLMAEAEKRVYADRSKWLGDTAFFHVPEVGLESKRYAAKLRAEIGPRATPATEIQPGQPALHESRQTTHYSVVAPDGSAVSTTTTLNGGYGNGEVVAGAGFLLNNEMDDFSAKPGSPNMFGLIGGVANAIEPGKRMLSSMSPTIVTKNGKVFLVVGSPGGSYIITAVLQVIMNVIDHGMNIQQAVDAPRFHDQWLPDYIRIERRGFPPALVSALEGMGYQVKEEGDMGDVEAVMIDPRTGTLYGAADPRAGGKAVGY
ncbi:MAG TPA: gamma-glutamyltransferase [Vicinamibacterales bacterium]|nr:gamma-glutamyltransferase [Vicinamibacterales bacterium]